MDSGGSLPPHNRRNPVRSVTPLALSTSSMGLKIAGTPLVTVTPSSVIASVISPRVSAENWPGSTSLAPARTVACTVPQVSTWNLGVMGLTTTWGVYHDAYKHA